jgi:hypothetical protein
MFPEKVMVIVFEPANKKIKLARATCKIKTAGANSNHSFMCQIDDILAG